MIRVQLASRNLMLYASSWQGNCRRGDTTGLCASPFGAGRDLMLNLRAFRVRHRTELFAEICQGSRGTIGSDADACPAAAVGCGLERASSGILQCAAKLDGQGNPFSGDSLIIRPMPYHAMPDRIERKRPHPLCDQRFPDLASQRHMNSPNTELQPSGVSEGHTTIGYLSTVEFEHKVGLAYLGVHKTSSSTTKVGGSAVGPTILALKTTLRR